MFRLKRCLILSVVIIITLSLAGCNFKPSVSEQTDFPININGVEIAAQPLRIAVLSPSLAEIVEDLGYGAVLCGRTDECDRGLVAELPSAGSSIAPNAGIVARWIPDLVITSSEPAEEFSAALHNSGIPLLIIPPVENYSELGGLYRTVGQVLAGKIAGETAGNALMNELGRRLDIHRMQTASQSEKPVILYAADAFGHVATGDTIAHMIIESAGGVNAAANDTQWAMTTENLESAQIILCPAHLVEQIKTKFADAPAVISGKVYGVDYRDFERQGMCISDAAEYVMSILYPPESPADTEPTEEYSQST